MQKLLAIEWLKLKKYRTFRVLSILFLVLLPLWNWGLYSSVVKLGKSNINIFSSTYSFPAVWSTLGFWASYFVMLLSILMIVLVSNEYTFRTHRQNVIDGWSRMDFFHGKVALVLAGSFFATLFIILVGLAAGLLVGGFSGIEGGWEKVLFFFVYTVNYLGFAALLAFWLRRSGLAIGMFFLYAFIIENMVGGIINWKAPKPVGDFLPLQSSDEMLPFPIVKMLANAIAGSNDFSAWVYLGVSCVWIGVYYLLGKRLVEKRDF